MSSPPLELGPEGPWSTFFELLPDATLALDPSGRVVLANRPARELLQGLGGILRGRRLDELLTAGPSSEGGVRWLDSVGARLDEEGAADLSVCAGVGATARKLRLALRKAPEGDLSFRYVATLRNESAHDELRLLRSELRRLRIIFNSVGDAVFLSPIGPGGTYGNFVEVNDEACRRLGYRREELLRMNAHTLNPDFNEERVAAFGRRIRRDGSLTLEAIHVARNGTRIPVGVTAKLLEIDGEQFVVSLAHDLRAKKSRLKSEERLGLLMEQSWDEIFIFEEGSLKVLRVNDGGLDNLGYACAELVGRPFPTLIGESDRSALMDRLELLRAGRQGIIALETELHRKDGTHYPVEMRIQIAPSEVPPVFVVNAHDISERRLAAERLYQMANFDSVTGLPNRSLMMDRLGQTLEIARRSHVPCALLFVDLDGFKAVNDSYGHDVGDHLLKVIGTRLASLIRSSDTVARFGGDEFTVLLRNLAAPAAAADVAKRIIDEISKPVTVGQWTLQITTSVGIAVFDGKPDEDIDTLLRRSDQAMYGAKRHGKNQWHVYSEA